jgi:putative ABC transport system substrate-binding protein
MKAAAPDLSRRAVLVAGIALATWRPARAQESGRQYKLGYLVQPPRSFFLEGKPGAPMFDELRRHGFVEGRNLVIGSRGFGTPVERLDAVAAEIAQTRPDAIYCGGVAACRAMKRATNTIPVIAASDDMVRDGIVPSLAHPGGNITGISILATELDGKRLALLVELVGRKARTAALVDPTTTAAAQVKVLGREARALRVALSMYQASRAEDIEAVIDRARADGAEALDVLASALFNAHHASIIAHANRVGMPAMYQWPEYAREGGLAGYGPRFSALMRQSAGLLVRVLKGERPADIPVEQPVQIELAINLRTAKALGLRVSQVLLERADEVIE